MQEASGVDFTDLYGSAHLPSIFDLATIASRILLGVPHSHSVFNRRPNARPGGVPWFAAMAVPFPRSSAAVLRGAELRLLKYDF
jgi:hypothetical protein